MNKLAQPGGKKGSITEEIEKLKNIKIKDLN